MACEITTGINLGCSGYTVGGNNRLWLLNKNEILRSFKNADGGIEDIIKKETAAPGVYYVSFYVDAAIETLGGNSDLVVNGGQRSFQHNVVLTIPSGTQEVLKFIADLGLSNVVAIIESKNPNEQVNFLNENKFYVFGLGNGLKLATNSNGLGIVNADLAGSTIVLQSFETTPHSEVELTYNAVPVAPTTTTKGQYATIESWIDRLLDNTSL
jgi:hypothetical protein